MKFTYSWLKDHIDINATSTEISSRLTNLGLEVEGLRQISPDYSCFLVAEIVSVEKHPHADRLSICKVSDGNNIFDVVCGAPNVKKGLKSVFAPIGSYIPGSKFKLEKKAIRGIIGEGMLCSEQELCISNNHEGIIELPKTLKLGTNYSKVAPPVDSTFEVGLTPNRGDCASVKGIARELVASGLGKFITKNSLKIKGKFKSPIKWEISNNKAGIACPHIIGRYFKSIINKESPGWLKAKLESIDLKPISALVDITNYLTYDLGRPMHVFDANKISGNLKIHFSKDNQTITALDENSYKLTNNDLVISDNKEIHSIAGIMGGKKSGVTNKTQNVFLEIANFNPYCIASSGQRLGILSDARYRFERGIDPDAMCEGMETATSLIREICGGEISYITEFKSKKYKKTNKIDYYPNTLKKQICINLEKNKQKKILLDLGFKIDYMDDIKWQLQPPSWRHDIKSNHDIIEEITRIYGYDKIPIKSLKNQRKSTKSILDDQDQKRVLLRDYMAHAGHHEMISLSFISSKEANIFSNIQDYVIIDNPISNELDVLRQSLIPNILTAGSKNLAKAQTNFSLFEIGYTYKGEELAEQELNLAVARFGLYKEKNWRSKIRKVDVFDAKSDILYALESIGIPEPTKISADAPKWYHPGRSGKIKLGNNTLGYFGELHPEIARYYQIKEKVTICELLINKTPELKNKNKTKQKLELLSLMPIKRDLSFLLPRKVRVNKLLELIKNIDQEKIGEIKVFDVYQGKEIPSNFTSIAVEIEIIQKHNTLTNNEIENLLKKIIEKVKNNLSGKLR